MKRHRLLRLTRWLPREYLLSCFSLFLLFIVPVGPVQSSNSQPAKPDHLFSSAMPQFPRGQHVVGFHTSKVYIAGMGHALIEEFVDANEVKPLQTQALPDSATSNVYPADDSNNVWMSYVDVWKGVDVSYRRSAEGLMESYFTIAPETDPRAIAMRYNLDFSLQKNGSIRYELPQGEGWYSQSSPIAWQVIAGERRAIDVTFKARAERTLGFDVSNYDGRYPLYIDPIYQWHTFYGSGNGDVGNAIALDAHGNIYVAGASQGSWLGRNGTPPLHAYSGGEDIVILKLNDKGEYLWHTFYGSVSGNDYAYDISIKGSSLYVAGRAVGNWKGDRDTDPLHAANSFFEMVVIKLNTDGVYQWHSFYGSSGYDFAQGIDNDDVGNVYVVGYSNTTWNGDGDIAPLALHSGTLNDDIVVLKLSAAGVYQWHTFYGSPSPDYGRAIIVDSANNLLITGSSGASWLGSGGTLPMLSHNGGGDAVVLKLDSAGVYIWHTFLGGAKGDAGYDMALDGRSNIYVAGWSGEGWKGPGNAEPRHPYSTKANIMVFKLNGSGVYQWHTFYGALDNGWETAKGIAVDLQGNVYVTGSTQAPWQGDNNTDPLHPHSDDGSGSAYDITVLKLDTNGLYKWHTFYGTDSSSDDEGLGIALHGDTGLFVTGSSSASWQGDKNRDPLKAYSASKDITVMKLLRAGCSFFVIGTQSDTVVPVCL